jgi:phosphate:Na+ symporter
MDQFEILEFISGIGVFLFGIDQLEKALKALSSRTLKVMLRKHTNHPLKSILGGTVATAILQSSSVVGLMTLAFVGAGILDMRNALGIILGSNLGTTFTGWIVATLGFKLSLSAFYLPMLGIGCLGLVTFGEDQKLRHYSRLLMGLGLLLMGLVLMKESIETFSQSFDVSIFQEYGVFVFFIVGVIFTAIIQSSSATMMITLSALNAQIIGLDSAAALVIGADLGTTGTVMLGALKGTPIKRQVAAAHFFFNLITDLLALLCLPLLLKIINDFYQVEDPLLGLVAFHSTFNVIGICLFIPFLGKFASMLERMFSEDTSAINRHIKDIPEGEIEESVIALEAETIHLFSRVFVLNLECFNIDASNIKPSKLIGSQPADAGYLNDTNQFDDGYEDIKQLENEIVEFAYRVRKGRIDPAQSARIEQLLETVRNAAYAAKEVKDIRHDLSYIKQSDNLFIFNIYQQILKQVEGFYSEASDLFNHHNTAVLLENYGELKRNTDDYSKAVTKEVYKDSQEHKLTEIDLSTMLNTVSEVSLSQTLLLRAMQSYLFHDESSRALASTV